MSDQKQNTNEGLWEGRECTVLTFKTGKAFFYKRFKARESRLANSLVYKSISGTPSEMASGSIQINLGLVLANFEGLLETFCAKVETLDGVPIEDKDEKVKFFDNLEVKEGESVQALLLDSFTKALTTSSVLDVKGDRAKKA